MAFIRIKKVNNSEYYYLVKSKWDPIKKSSTQITIKYLGKASDVTINDIPEQYRNNKRIISIITSKSGSLNYKSFKKNIKMEILEALKNGDVDKIIKIAERYKNQTSLSEFYDSILRNVMYEIGFLWSQGKLDVGTEHICSNTANKVIHKLNMIKNRDDKNFKILICTPTGELHNIGCNILESVLLENGYKVYNISPSVPSDIAAKYVKEINPSLILVSITLLDIIGSAKRLVKKIGTNIQAPILIGGLAINKSNETEWQDFKSMNRNVRVITDAGSRTLIPIVKSLNQNATVNT